MPASIFLPSHVPIGVIATSSTFTCTSNSTVLEERKPLLAFVRYNSRMSKGKNPSFVDYYELLGVQTTVSDQTLRKAFLLKAKAAHPDAGGSTEAMQQLNKAYKTL
ncbi:J domain-containing protein, partial [Candidatus Saccharibacteria bacterium]|nr:J domain-containing protein [Candidatus Saccharibacteria bacterium]